MKNKIYLFCLLLIFAVTAAGCDSDFERQGQTEQLPPDVGRMLEGVLDKTAASGQELEKLYQFEYTVFRLPVESSPTKLEGLLNELGKKRWECFQVEKVFSKEENSEMFVIFCRRNPDTPLRYLPRTLVGR